MREKFIRMKEDLIKELSEREYRWEKEWREVKEKIRSLEEKVSDLEANRKEEKSVGEREENEDGKGVGEIYKKYI